ncbi:hypothetical protein [Evansella tamaricis]
MVNANQFIDLNYTRMTTAEQIKKGTSFLHKIYGMLVYVPLPTHQVQ